MIDDNAYFLRLMHLRLQAECPHFDVRVERNAFEAVSAAREFLPDIILLDVIMPGKDGGDVAMEMRADPQLCKTPIVFFTGLVARADSGGVVTARGMQYLSKTTDTELIIACIESNLAQQAAA